jgi:hypothetical protein
LRPCGRSPASTRTTHCVRRGGGRGGEGGNACIHADAHVRRGGGRGGDAREHPRGRYRVRTNACACPCGQWGASVRTPHVRSNGSVSPQVTSKRTLQCIQVTDAPAAIVRPSVRPSVRYRPRDNPVVGAVLVWVSGLFFYLIAYGIEYRFQTYHASEDHQCEASSFIKKVYALRSEADVCSYRPAAEMLKPAPCPCCCPFSAPYPCCSSPAPYPA